MPGPCVWRKKLSANIASLHSLSPGHDLDAYIQTVNAMPVLTPEAERELAEKYYFENDLHAARELVLGHLRFVVHLARTYRGYGLSESDIIQEGNVGLMKAVKRFDPTKGFRLISFAVHWIKAEIHEFVLRNWRIVKIATTKEQRKLFFNLRNRKKTLSWLNVRETEAIAADLGVDPKVVTQMEGRLKSRDMAFDGYAAEDDDEIIAAPAQFLGDDSANPEQLSAADQWSEQSNEFLHQAIAELDDRTRDILESRWLNDDKETLQSLATRYSVSAERIRQLENNAMKKLKVGLEERSLTTAI